jgi:hypothetical protein
LVVGKKPSDWKCQLQTQVPASREEEHKNENGLLPFVVFANDQRPKTNDFSDGMWHNTVYNL